LYSIDQLKHISIDIRKKIVEITHSAKGGHIGGSLSSVDILVALYFSIMRYDPSDPSRPDRDRFIMSKGHSVEGLYCVLARAGYFPEALLSEYGKFDTVFYGHPTLKVPGIEMPTGSLGHGLSIAVGMALGAKRDKATSRIFVLMGDGEQAEGSIWEAAMAASHYKLDNLVAIIDNNNLQISGHIDSVMRLSSLRQKYEAFGWNVAEIDGHDFHQLIEAFNTAPWRPEMPNLIIAHTIKGRGVSFMENSASWHHKVLTDEDFERAIDELDRSEKEAV
jgi:transketolase